MALEPIYIGLFPCFAKLTPDQHPVISGGWVNDISPQEIAEQLSLNDGLVTAYYLVMDIMFHRANGYWPEELYS